MKEYHVAVGKQDLPSRYMIVVGDPGRVLRIGNFLKDPKEIAFNREYRTLVGSFESQPISVGSLGIGAPSTAIGLEEYARCGVDTFIRVGTSGGLGPSVHLGDVVCATAAVRDEGTSRQYIPLEYPAVSSIDVVLAIREAATSLGLRNRYYEGICHSKDCFYSEEASMMPDPDTVERRWSIWKRAGVLATEMECSLLFALGSIRNWRTGAVLAVIGLTAGENSHPVIDKAAGVDEAIQIALNALVLLAQRD
jgi:uridine phosphorylase